MRRAGSLTFRLAETQSEFLLKLLLYSSEEAKGKKDETFDTPLLSAEELNICRRGRNAVGKNSGRTPKRLGADQNVYQDSTAWEALLGYVTHSNCKCFIVVSKKLFMP